MSKHDERKHPYSGLSPAAKNVLQTVGAERFGALLFLLESDLPAYTVAKMMELTAAQVTVWRMGLTEPRRKLLPELEAFKSLSPIFLVSDGLQAREQTWKGVNQHEA